LVSVMIRGMNFLMTRRKKDMLDRNAKTRAFDASFSPESVIDTKTKIARTNR